MIQSGDLLLILLFLSHNYWTRNPASHPKNQKTLSLISNKNFSEILPSSSLGLGPDEVGENSLKLLHLRGGASRPARSLLMVLHALWLECEKSMELTASSHRSCFFCCSRESRDEAALSEAVATGAR